MFLEKISWVQAQEYFEKKDTFYASSLNISHSYSRFSISCLICS